MRSLRVLHIPACVFTVPPPCCPRYGCVVDLSRAYLSHRSLACKLPSHQSPFPYAIPDLLSVHSCRFSSRSSCEPMPNYAYRLAFLFPLGCQATAAAGLTCARSYLLYAVCLRLAGMSAGAPRCSGPSLSTPGLAAHVRHTCVPRPSQIPFERPPLVLPVFCSSLAFGVLQPFRICDGGSVHTRPRRSDWPLLANTGRKRRLRCCGLADCEKEGHSCMNFDLLSTTHYRLV
ncbi:hypothetical protein BV25DRAFT_1077060 [Artomyces pyxidatus]|uniref:Uncharacterized protein n=1 Tax=Artomyces pyxidatus TaxID=48021 RepID=A0ACB8TFP9_9AGAM|nr:hypothetical protein BV25DRAFT_1077060 [Artomyces pyxidatus]